MRGKREKILVFMSGGVDSSVAAALLIRAGYDVTGAFMVDYDDPAAPNCWRGDYQDAIRVAAKLGIKLLRWDFVKEYKKLVLDHMYREYAAGRTPNPDVLCNKYIKFGVWLKKTKKMGFDKIATGHYARLGREFPISNLSSPRRRGSSSDLDSRWSLPSTTIGGGNDNVELLQSKDDNKDQTYFLHQLNQDQLRHVIFPIGGYTKPEVRKLAKKFNLPTAEKEESMGICFVGEAPMKEFLQKKIKIKKGKIVTSDGQVAGEHDGLAFYTIGQRIGVESVIPAQAGIQSSHIRQKIKKLDSLFQGNDNARLLFVVGKNIKKNELVVGNEDNPLLYKKEIRVGEINWISGHPPKFPLKCKVRLRHRQELQDAVMCLPLEEGEMKRGSALQIKFARLQRAATPGQFAVFYLKGECLGGGVIL